MNEGHFLLWDLRDSVLQRLSGCSPGCILPCASFPLAGRLRPRCLTRASDSCESPQAAFSSALALVTSFEIVKFPAKLYTP